MKSTYTIKLIKIFVTPFIYAFIGIGLLVIVVKIFWPSNPVSPSTILAVLTVGYISWFLGEGRKELRELNANHKKNKSNNA